MQEFVKEKLRNFYTDNQDLSLEELMTKAYSEFAFFDEFGYILHLYFMNQGND